MDDRHPVAAGDQGQPAQVVGGQLERTEDRSRTQVEDREPAAEGVGDQEMAVVEAKQLARLEREGGGPAGRQRGPAVRPDDQVVAAGLPGPQTRHGDHAVAHDRAHRIPTGRERPLHLDHRSGPGRRERNQRTLGRKGQPQDQELIPIAVHGHEPRRRVRLPGQRDERGDVPADRRFAEKHPVRRPQHAHRPDPVAHHDHLAGVREGCHRDGLGAASSAGRIGRSGPRRRPAPGRETGQRDHRGRKQGALQPRRHRQQATHPPDSTGGRPASRFAAARRA